MKKLIIVLMVVAMASFLFTGCLKGVTTDTTTDTTTTTVTVPATKAPIITWVSDNPLNPLAQAGVMSLTSTAAQYVNKAQSARGIVIHGTAPTYSEVKVYLDGIVAGTADTLAGSTWSCVITLSELGKDGAKTVHATAIEPGCTESKKSNEVKFTLDRTPPKMTSVAAYFAAAHYKVGFSEDVNIDVDISVATGTPASALNPANWSAAMAAAANTIFGLQALKAPPAVIVGDVFTAVSTNVIKIEPAAAPTSNPIVAADDSYALFCWNIVDVAGNPIAGAPTNLAAHKLDTLTVVLDRSKAVIYSVTLP